MLEQPTRASIASPTGGDNSINNDEHNHDQGVPTSCRSVQTDPIEGRTAICQTRQVADFKTLFML